MIKIEPIKSNNILEIFLIILKTSALTLGGGILIISELKKIIVDKKKIISEEDFHEVLTTSSIIPGANIINFSFLLGKKLGGFHYSVLFVIAGLLPSILVITFIALYANLDSENVYFQKFLEGSKVSSAIIITIVTIEFSKRMMKNSYIKWIICILVIYTLNNLKIDFSYLLLVFLVVYIIKYNFLKNKKNREKI